MFILVFNLKIKQRHFFIKIIMVLNICFNIFFVCDVVLENAKSNCHLTLHDGKIKYIF